MPVKPVAAISLNIPAYENRRNYGATCTFCAFFYLRRQFLVQILPMSRGTSKVARQALILWKFLWNFVLIRLGFNATIALIAPALVLYCSGMFQYRLPTRLHICWNLLTRHICPRPFDHGGCKVYAYNFPSAPASFLASNLHHYLLALRSTTRSPFFVSRPGCVQIPATRAKVGIQAGGLPVPCLIICHSNVINLSLGA